MKIPEHKRFFAVNGRNAGSISDLRLLIEEMSQEDFHHHVTESRNDFANWTRDILHDDHLADKLLRVKTKEHTFEVLNDELVKEKEVDIEQSDEFKRFIAKEFIYGMFFGLILGMILSRLI